MNLLNPLNLHARKGVSKGEAALKSIAFILSIV